ncbi:hypothetical protein NMG60_11012763 [Bertholletia excelsa]
MAFSARHFSSLFLLALFFSLHAHARDSQFFSKVPTAITTTTTNHNSAQETLEVPSKGLRLNKQDQEPNFIRETQNGYGLYGHETGLLPPSTTARTPLKEESDEPFPTSTNTNKDYYNQNAYATEPQHMSDTRDMYRGYTTTFTSNPNPNNYDNYNKDAYVTDRQHMRDTRFMDTGYTTTNNYYNDANNYNNEEFRNSMFMDRGYTIPTNRYNTQQQGMSDTRFLENGKYFYDLNLERNYPKRYQRSRGSAYNNQGYYGKNGNPHEYSNSMENLEEFQEEGPEEFVP